MPSSSPELLTDFTVLLMKLNPKQVLDVGAGFGKWGLLAREYLDVWQRLSRTASTGAGRFSSKAFCDQVERLFLR